MVMLPTPKFQPSPCVMLVAFDDLLAHRLGEIVKLPVLRVQHAPAARERLLVTWPLALLVGGSVPRDEFDMLSEAAAGMGIEMLQLSGSFHDGLVRGWLTRAMALAGQRRQSLISKT